MDTVRILGHKAVRAALRDTETYSSDLQGDADVRDYRQIPLEVDPPRHHMYRSALSPLFVRPTIQGLEPQFSDIAHTLLEEFTRSGGGDFVSQVALPFVVNCLGVIYGRPQDVDEWLSWGPDVWTAESDRRSGRALHAYLERVYYEPVNSESTCAWSFVKNLEFDGNRVSFEEFKGIGSVLLAGGRDTVVKLMSGALWHFMRTPDDVNAIRTNEVSLDSAIQEMLRAFTPLPAMLRVPPEQQPMSDAERDVSTFVAIDFASANYDSDVFAEPNRINIRRERIAHVAFGFGPHTCIGNHIAEIETRVLFEVVLPRLGDWAFSSEPTITWQRAGDFDFPERFESLPVKVSS